MVAPLGFFDALQVLLQVLLIEECRCIQPLELLARLITFPVCTRHRQQLKRPDRARARHMRSAAQIDKLALAIKRQHLVLAKPTFDMLNLITLFEIAADLQRFLSRFFDPFEGLIQLDDFHHLGFDRWEVFLA